MTLSHYKEARHSRRSSRMNCVSVCVLNGTFIIDNAIKLEAQHATMPVCQKSQKGAGKGRGGVPEKTETKDEKETWCDSDLKMGRWCGGRWMRWCSHLQGLRHERSSLQLTELFHVQRCAAVKSESFNSAAAKVLEAIKSPVLLNTRVENSLSLQHRASTFHFCHRHKWALANGNMASFSSSASERRQKAVFPPQPTYSKSISDAPSLRHQAPSRWKCPFGKGGGGV